MVGVGNTKVINDGTISGGWSADGLQQANAIEFTGGGNTLEIHSNSIINGKAIAVQDDPSQNDTFALGGSGNASFNVSELGTKYIGFTQVEKTGSSTWTVDGKTTEVTPWTIQQGTLILGSTVASNASIGGDMGVNHGGTLGGYGTVGGDLVNHGVVSPGGAPGTIGTLHVGGDYTQAGDGSLVVDVNQAAHQSDLLLAGGAANLAGNVHVNAADNTTWYSHHVIVKAEEGVDGTFDTVTDNYTNIDTVVNYTPNTAEIGLFRNDVVFHEVEDLTKNQESTAEALDEIDRSGPLYHNILIAGEENAGRTFDALSGEIHASVASGLLTAERISRGVMSDNIRGRVRDSGSTISHSAPQETYTDSKSGLTTQAPAEETSFQSSFALWGELVADDLTLDGNGNAAKMEQNLAGVFVGANASLGGGWESGIAYGHTSGDLDVDDRDSSADIENNTLGLTIGKSWDTGDNAINFLFGGTYTRSGVETKREVAVGNLNETLEADYDVNTFQLFTEVAYEVKLADRTILEPFLGFGWATLDGDEYQEKSGYSALSGEGISAEQFNSIVGLRFRQGFDAGPLPAWVQASVGWEHNYGDREGVAINSFNGGNGFRIEGAEIDRDAAVLDLGVGVNLTESLSIGGSYIGRFSENNRENTYRLNLNYKF